MAFSLSNLLKPAYGSPLSYPSMAFNAARSGLSSLVNSYTPKSTPLPRSASYPSVSSASKPRSVLGASSSSRGAIGSSGLLNSLTGSRSYSAGGNVFAQAANSLANRGPVLGAAAPISPQMSSQIASSQQPQSGGGMDFESLVKQALEMQRSANQPLVDSYNQAISQTKDIFDKTRSGLESQRKPLQERYQSLLSDIKGQGKLQEDSQTRITNSELAKRGILGSSTAAQQEVQSALNPIRTQTQAATGQLGAQQQQANMDLESALLNLAGQQASGIGQLQGGLAQAQAGSSSNAIQQALQLLGMNRDYGLAKQDRTAATPTMSSADLFASL